MAGVALGIALPLALLRERWGPAALAVLTLLVTSFLVWAVIRRQGRDLSRASETSRLMETVLRTSRERLWSIGPDGRFTFSGPMSQELVGYAPSELLGKHFGDIIEPDDLAEALRNRINLEGPDSSWCGLVTVCRHRDGSRVLVEVSGRPIFDGQGQKRGFEGTNRALDTLATGALAAQGSRAGVEAMLASRNLLTAFQPILNLDTGAVIGAEALTRFLSSESPGISPEAWFVEAASVGLGVDLELLTLQSALAAAAGLPEELYIAVNLSPRACLDHRVPDVLGLCGIPLRRIVLELTERHEVTDYGQLSSVLAPLRRMGVRIAVDDAGAGFASMRHIVELRPHMIKLDREIIAGINTDTGQRALGAAMVGFAAQIGASLVAEGIETDAELETVKLLGMTAAQGYLLGRPTVKTEEWKLWGPTTTDDIGQPSRNSTQD
ncbi:EAL domain-containing protein [Pseudarthrobacter sp. NPDC055928]|uniref:sensor domain-containing phosphodiesterase n=1 Tax=Pseudarthrobacter sp. NPDC055928 TaxID=3345661 RepID=UPI0035E0F506